MSCVLVTIFSVASPRSAVLDIMGVAGAAGGIQTHALTTERVSRDRLSPTRECSFSIEPRRKFFLQIISFCCTWLSRNEKKYDVKPTYCKALAALVLVPSASGEALGMAMAAAMQ